MCKRLTYSWVLSVYKILAHQRSRPSYRKRLMHKRQCPLISISLHIISLLLFFIPCFIHCNYEQYEQGNQTSNRSCWVEKQLFFQKRNRNIRKSWRTNELAENQDAWVHVWNAVEPYRMVCVYMPQSTILPQCLVFLQKPIFNLKSMIYTWIGSIRFNNQELSLKIRFHATSSLFSHRNIFHM